MKKYKIITNNINQTNFLIDTEQIKNAQNKNNLQSVKPIYISLFKNKDFSTDFESVNGFVKEGEQDVSILYKQWSVVLYIKKELEENIDFILPIINYEIIYKDPVENNFSFYSSNDDLHTSYFYEIQENSLILHVSFYIQKIFNGSTINVPEAKLHINFINDFNINQ